MNTQKTTYAHYLLNRIAHYSDTALHHLQRQNYEGFAIANGQVTVLYGCAELAITHDVISDTQFSAIDDVFRQHHCRAQSIYDELEQLIMR